MPHAWLPILLPFLGAAVLAFRGRRLSETQIGLLASGAVGVSFVFAVLIWLQMLARHGAPAIVRGPTWIAVGPLDVGFHLLVDPLSSVMALVVTGVGFLIHLYARGYMHGHPHYPRFFALLNLFVGAMMTLVLADNLPMTFIGWEGVGFCSYMLIGFDTERFAATRAGKKAFIVNRVGDLGFLAGMFLVWNYFHTFNYTTLAQAGQWFVPGDPTLTAAALCFFVGACGKSAQFPLYVWLPDAMEGPTPVSALIHAATMVTSGVYLTVRLGVVYALAPAALHVVAGIGLLTAVLAAGLALVQNDIKKVLAYSTISQLGYMFLAAGMGAYSAAIFHLVTHAFFKALLFLCSGSVIHAMEHALHAVHEPADAQDMRNMGGLARKMPFTYGTMLVGAMAIAGVPGLSGFFSKDEILYHTGQHNLFLMAVGLLVAAMTAFYMFRLIYKTFLQEPHLPGEAYAHLEESPPVMTQPLVALAVLSVVGGILNLPALLPRLAFTGQWLSKYLTPVTNPAMQFLGGHEEAQPAAEWGGMVISAIIALCGIGLAWWMYCRQRGKGAQVARRVPEVYTTLVNLYYLDEAYQRFIVRPGHRLAEWCAAVFDQGVVDYAVNEVAAFFGLASAGVRRYQPGFVRSYVMWFAVGAAVLLGTTALRGTSPVIAVLVGLLVLALVVGAVIVARPRDGV